MRISDWSSDVCSSDLLNESMAMWPVAAVSGWYYAHPQWQYFVVGRVNKDQVADYARRKGWTQAQAEKWLAPNLGYEPEDCGRPCSARRRASLCSARTSLKDRKSVV